jgi:branched-chain amino acid transport system permease protein
MLLFPFFGYTYITLLLFLAYTYIIYSSSWNVLLLSGQVSLGHAVFFGIGAYTASLSAIGISPWLLIPLGASLSSLIATPIGALCCRLREWFLSLTTFAFPLVMVALCYSFKELGGSLGFPVVTSPAISSLQLYYICLLLMILTLMFIYIFVKKTRIGLAFAAIKQDEVAARSLGINAVKYKILAFNISTFFAGMAGVLYAFNSGWVSPDLFITWYCILPALLCALGGMESFEGPIIGSFLFLCIWEILRKIHPVLGVIILGCLMILLIVFVPEGIPKILSPLYSFFRGESKRSE